MQRFKVTVEKENKETNQTLVSIEPLDQGYGHTLGNGLRRCLLNSMPGAAITSVKIAGVDHQFSTITGVIEDVIEIILNLKKVRLKIYSDSTTKNKSIRLTLEKSGTGEVKASDINAQGMGEIVNPDQHIATITDSKTKLSMEMTAEVGVGYSPSDDRKTNEIGVMQIDAIFSPILSVNYTVEQTRVGRRTDFDKLNMDIVSDGTISALDAVNQSAQILAEYFTQVYQPAESEEVEVSSNTFVSDDLLKASVEELDLPVRITNALKAIEVDTIEKLTTIPKLQLIKAKNLGAKSLSLISEKLGERGLALGEA